MILRGTFNTIRSAARHLTDNAAAFNRKVINISSVAGVHGGSGGVNYSAAKAGVIGLSKALAREWAPLGVNVLVNNAGLVCSAPTQEMTDEQWDLV